MEFDVSKAMKIKLSDELPEKTEFKEGIRRAPRRELNLSQEEMELALKNALRYIPPKLHEELAPEFMDELLTHGRIYGYRYRPEGEIKAKPIHEYKGKTLEGKALQLMIDNNLDFDVALYPYELVTYGETGQVCQNWMQYRLIKKYLQEMTQDQTLVVQSGHPLGLFPSKPEAPRVISTNGLMVGMYDNLENFNKAAALGVANYGQMTAGGWMYIGPQGIVHGTYNTLLNAGRKFLDNDLDEDLSGQLYITSGLGGMSGAQAKAVEIAGGIGVIAEVDESRIETRHEQGWLSKISDDLDEIFDWVAEYQQSGEAVSIAYHGNVVDLLDYVVENDIEVDLLSDQTSCHEPYTGGYNPVGFTFEEGRELLNNKPEEFRKEVDKSLRKHYSLIKKLVDRGAYFFDYGNSFMKAVYDAGVKEIAKNEDDPTQGFIFPSYVEDVMGPICFDYGYGPFRWVCLSGKDEDLRKTDQAAMECIDPDRRAQDYDNYQWIADAEENELVVGSKARILYADGPGRVEIALKFNELVREGEIGPVMLGRDHHDVSGTDSPFRETANIKDGSNIMAEMSVHCFAGNCARGMTLAVESNGGGVGIGKAFNGGFGLVLDGSKRVDEIIKSALDWDVHSGVARRAWARNENAIETMMDWNKEHGAKGHATLPYQPEEGLVEDTVANSLKEQN
ncbi:urocanate hydratase [Acetohalobium arabaticum]|uniref:Urocanate hydratase n=1 Tax=Acetohalobium arabaticum (strain ATCC 49924 / DSM 5501 / Z-7288) TaxID=574087 RepID=D9QSH9_ACEAZ|nr:urocanate hydratase [Acetohalobium arabaticum]ADL13442.1 urocanate hydratase [Acetohalobium arabaticum DSM 5501]